MSEWSKEVPTVEGWFWYKPRHTIKAWSKLQPIYSEFKRGERRDRETGQALTALGGWYRLINME